MTNPQPLLPITGQDIMKGKQNYDQLSPKLRDNLCRIVDKMNRLQTEYGVQLVVDPQFVASAYGQNTLYQGRYTLFYELAAINIIDNDGALFKWILNNLEFVKNLDLWMIDFNYTPTSVTFQLYEPKNNLRIYVPDFGTPVNPLKWNGRYDSKYN